MLAGNAEPKKSTVRGKTYATQTGHTLRIDNDVLRTWTTSDCPHRPGNPANKVLTATRLGMLPTVADTLQALARTGLPTLDVHFAAP